MDFAITEDQLRYKEAITEFAINVLNGNKDEETFSREMWQKCADFGILGLSVPKEYGGLGEGYLESLLAMEALGYGCKNNGFLFALTNHLWACQNVICKYGNYDQKRRYLKEMVSGKIIGGYALTEPTAGSDVFAMETVATLNKDGDYILNGMKTFISNAPIADVFVVLAITENNEDTKSLSAFIVQKNVTGLRIGTEICKMGLRACPMSEIIFDNCVITKENVLGNIGSGMNLVNLTMEWERCFELACCVGTMERVLEQCIEYAQKRKQFNASINTYQQVSTKMSDMKVSIEMAKLMMYKIGWLKDNKKRSFLDSSIFKLYVSENYVKCCLHAMQIFGAYGYSCECDIEREVRDSLASTIYAGTSEIQRNIIFRMIN